jgi:type II secretory pathway pseudopilin PulG
MPAIIVSILLAAVLTAAGTRFKTQTLESCADERSRAIGKQAKTTLKQNGPCVFSTPCWTLEHECVERMGALP